VLAAPFPVLWMIVRFGVNVPIEDQIDIGAFLVRNHDRLIPAFADLFAQHNESRKVIPRLIIFYLARLTNWNVKYEMAMQVVIACGTVAALWFLARRSLGERALPATTLCALLVLSPVQWWNWLFGIQIVVFLPMLMLTIALAIAGSLFPLRSRAVIAGLCCLIATYSYANGMLLWILVAAALFARREDRRPVAIALWFVAAAVSIGCYFVGYHRPPVSPTLISPLNHPLQAAAFVLAFLGHSLAWTDALTVSVIIGGIGAVLFAFFAVRARWAGLPWILIGSYSLISAAAAAMGRLGFGMWAAIEPRYTTFAVGFWVAVVVLAVLEPHVIPSVSEGPGWSGRPASPRPGRSVTLAMTWGTIPMTWGAILALHIAAAIAVFPKVRECNRDRLIARASVHFSRVLPDSSLFRRLVYRDPGHAIPILSAVSQIGYLEPALADTPVIHATGSTKGAFEGVLRTGPHQYAMYGWALLPDGRLADAVLIARDGRIVAISERTIARPDRPAPGWDLPVTQALAIPGAVYNAFAYDTSTGRAYQLAGSVRAGRR
jgi:hypothetical protein